MKGNMTKLLYLDDFDVVECEAKVIKLEEHDGNQVVVLNQTCFYPKGGGQDFDHGTIASGDTKFVVEAVFYVDQEVKHIGHYEKGELKIDAPVNCSVDQERRMLNTRIHSGGHLLDMAVRKIGYEWVPGKGAHYPHMAFVEYAGEFNGDEKQRYIDELQSTIDKLISNGSTNTIQFMTPDEMTKHGAVVPDNMPKDKPARAVFYDDFAVPCGGTHVKDISEVGKLTVTNIKRKDGNIRVSYSVND